MDPVVVTGVAPRTAAELIPTLSEITAVSVTDADWELVKRATELADEVKELIVGSWSSDLTTVTSTVSEELLPAASVAIKVSVSVVDPKEKLSYEYSFVHVYVPELLETKTAPAMDALVTALLSSMTAVIVTDLVWSEVSNVTELGVAVRFSMVGAWLSTLTTVTVSVDEAVFPAVSVTVTV